MKKHFRTWAIFAAIVLLGLTAAAGQTSADTAKDPVCGMSVKTAGAAYMAEHLGKTYYFCSESCKAAFLKDPAKFVAAEAAETPAPAEKACCGMCCPGCPMMAKMKMKMKMMPGQALEAPAPGAPPAPPAAPGAATPECPMMKDAAKPGCPMMGHREMRMKRMPGQGMAMKPGMMGRMAAGVCPMGGGWAGKADILVENTPDGAVVRISSKDPETVKMIQEHLAAMKSAKDPAECPKAKKAEEKK
jgi:YHS domain-containing protein